MSFYVRVFLVLVCLQIIGCASIKYEPVLVDSAVPTLGGKPLSAQLPCPDSLDAGMSCTAVVRAENWFSDTGLRVRAGESYCIRTPKGQVWFDAGRRNSPPIGDSGSSSMNLFKPLKRHGFPWFTLMAGVVDFHGNKMQTSEVLKSSVLRQFKRMDGDGKLEIAEAGALVMYPNDARGPEYFYANNSGQIWVQISHLQPTEVCTDRMVQ
jgi:hypothetical protein